MFILGLFTRMAAAVMCLVFTCALSIVHLNDPYMKAFPAIVMLAGALFLLFNGSGKASIDSGWKSKIFSKEVRT